MESLSLELFKSGAGGAPACWAGSEQALPEVPFAALWWQEERCVTVSWEWEPVLLLAAAFLVRVELHKFDSLFPFFFSPHHPDIPLLKEA